MGEENSSHGSQCLVGSYIERRFLLDSISDVRVKAAIVAACCLYLSGLLSYLGESSPVRLGLKAPFRAPLRPIGTVRAAQNFLLRIHSILHKRAARAVQQHVIFGSIGDDAGVQRCPQAGIFHVDVEGVINLRILALTEGRGPDRLRLTEEDERLIDEMRAQIPENPGSGVI